MFLTRLIYVSTATEKFASSSLEDILQVGRLNNTKNGITGMLCFKEKYFIQCLEGSRKAINHTYNKILKDERHTNVVLLEYSQINVREFNDWCMGYIPTSHFTEPLILKYSKSAVFRPYDMSRASAYMLLLEFKKNYTSF
ncbi:BLUF domain-containing protein [Psychromonas sp. Urea-02u-13]|uniref:BLUF domain-containing protein n=1 Tax=Psychromonas sp. Urea-02u-13 TaxID=2058326 RepID=UPI000C33F7B8|nr:BLUF domain-containing protein [Psychromonas sp. Urea-02u-13]PKG37301.1 blue light sensor protein [Psychromonas sp. Urea-02u-13]